MQRVSCRVLEKRNVRQMLTAIVLIGVGYSGAFRAASRIAFLLSVGLCGLTIRRTKSVGLILPGAVLSNSPYFNAELISTPICPVYPMPANLAASRYVHSLPAFCSRTASGILRHCEIACFGNATCVVAPRAFLALFPAFAFDFSRLSGFVLSDSGMGFSVAKVLLRT